MQHTAYDKRMLTWMYGWLPFLKTLLSVVTSNMSVEGDESRVGKTIATLQWKCSHLTIFLSFLSGNFLVVRIFYGIQKLEVK